MASSLENKEAVWTRWIGLDGRSVHAGRWAGGGRRPRLVDRRRRDGGGREKDGERGGGRVKNIRTLHTG